MLRILAAVLALGLLGCNQNEAVVAPVEPGSDEVVLRDSRSPGWFVRVETRPNDVETAERLIGDDGVIRLHLSTSDCDSSAKAGWIIGSDIDVRGFDRVRVTARVVVRSAHQDGRASYRFHLSGPGVLGEHTQDAFPGQVPFEEVIDFSVEVTEDSSPLFFSLDLLGYVTPVGVGKPECVGEVMIEVYDLKIIVSRT